MVFEEGQVVVSQAGHDKGNLYCVIGVDGEFLLLADGKRKKVDRPKRKRRSHAAGAGYPAHPHVLSLRRNGQSPADSELRRALAAVRDQMSSDQGGNTLGKK
ncbi:hypothetical protein SDC9_110713 [bioreactor metagenome]|uniref:50S ribosomal protein L14 n=1 Tax=bioreactor metagenome TaxID=1076179 RepID=A0A645BEG1_9ZZZZ